ncbi:hypothetical protein SAMN05216297_104313 [Flavobacterium phragmitis]|uniref:Uncharacterized protein n=1 Tax=Flavobacterium phragmitis TaxID=739143 RepID=A0A1I1PWP3_9FLAO|nr:hypothetical protein SAMN05216297_104313 [Flavobacterium phragmitis]
MFCEIFNNFLKTTFPVNFIDTFEGFFLFYDLKIN